jgi:hypothetical protein
MKFSFLAYFRKGLKIRSGLVHLVAKVRGLAETETGPAKHSNYGNQVKEEEEEFMQKGHPYL